jgi:PhnB protein
MSFCPYLGFGGNCREAMTFYADIFGATDLEFMTGADAPPGAMGSDWGDKIMHSQFSMGGVPLMGADAPPDWFKAQAGVSVFHGARDKPDAERIFGRLSEGATINMPLGKTFWSEAFGMLTDRFGTNWMISLAPKDGNYSAPRS